MKKIVMYLRTRGSNHGLGIPRKMRLMNFGKKLLKNSKIFHLDYDESLTDFKKKMKMENVISVWDIDSTTMAFQLTMLDAQLFLKVSSVVPKKELMNYKLKKFKIRRMGRGIGGGREPRQEFAFCPIFWFE